MALIKLFSNTERFENQPGNYYKYAKNVKKKKDWVNRDLDYVAISAG